MAQLLALAFFLASLVYIAVRSRNEKIAFYTGKRREFPWLDKWLGEKKYTNQEGLLPYLWKTFKTLIFYYVMAAVVIGIPTYIVLGILGLVGSAVVNIIGGILVCAFIVGGTHNDNMDTSLCGVRGCPKCNCPEAWSRTNAEKFVLENRSEASTVKTTTVYESGRQTTATDDYLTEHITYNVANDWECANCGHTEHIEQVKKTTVKYVNGGETWSSMFFSNVSAEMPYPYTAEQQSYPKKGFNLKNLKLDALLAKVTGKGKDEGEGAR